jgi:hypothetical protein
MSEHGTGIPMRLRKASDSLKEQYADVLAFAREVKSPEAVGNLYPWHSELAVIELMRHAIQLQKDRKNSNAEPATVSLLTGACPDHVYGRDAYDKFADFVRLGGKLKIVAWAEKLRGSVPRLMSLRRDYRDNVDIRLSRVDEPEYGIPHFLLVERSAYRFEPPHESCSGQEVSDFEPEVPARICFNDSESGQQLGDFFNDIFEKCGAADS